ncbi:MAG: hypothetical protein AB1440_28185 [Pseudomonadota bacterium]
MAVFPPPLFLVALIVMLALRYFWPLSIGGRPLTMVRGIVLAALAIAAVAWERTTMLRGGTNIDPTKPALSLKSGPQVRRDLQSFSELLKICTPRRSLRRHRTTAR